MYLSKAVAANLSYVRGSHTIKAGWDGRLYFDNQSSLDVIQIPILVGIALNKIEREVSHIN